MKLGKYGALTGSIILLAGCQMSSDAAGLRDARLDAYYAASEATEGALYADATYDMPVSGTATYEGQATIAVGNQATTRQDLFAGTSTYEARFTGYEADIDGKLENFVVREDLSVQELEQVLNAYASADTTAEQERALKSIMQNASVIDGEVILTARGEYDPSFLTFATDGTLTSGTRVTDLSGQTSGAFMGDGAEYLAVYGSSDDGLSFDQGGQDRFGILLSLSRK